MLNTHIKEGYVYFYALVNTFLKHQRKYFHEYD